MSNKKKKLNKYLVSYWRLKFSYNGSYGAVFNTFIEATSTQDAYDKFYSQFDSNYEPIIAITPMSDKH